MITLESFKNEINAEFYDIEMDLCLIRGTNVYTEAANEAKENIFQRAIKKIKELFQKVKDKITEFIQDRESRTCKENRENAGL